MPYLCGNSCKACAPSAKNLSASSRGPVRAVSCQTNRAFPRGPFPFYDDRGPLAGCSARARPRVPRPSTDLPRSAAMAVCPLALPLDVVLVTTARPSPSGSGGLLTPSPAAEAWVAKHSFSVQRKSIFFFLVVVSWKTSQQPVRGKVDEDLRVSTNPLYSRSNKSMGRMEMSVSKKTTWELKIVHRFDFLWVREEEVPVNKGFVHKEFETFKVGHLKPLRLAFFVQTMGRGLPTVGAGRQISQYFRWKGLEMLEE